MFNTQLEELMHILVEYTFNILVIYSLYTLCIHSTYLTYLVPISVNFRLHSTNTTWQAQYTVHPSILKSDLNNLINRKYM